MQQLTLAHENLCEKTTFDHRILNRKCELEDEIKLAPMNLMANEFTFTNGFAQDKQKLANVISKMAKQISKCITLHSCHFIFIFS